MITISLDEQGDFEKVKKNTAPRFIGGIIYDDLGYERDSRKEEDRINLYLQAVCFATNTTFPNDLHLDYSASNGSKVREVKKTITETLPEFLQMGTCSLKDNLYAEDLNNGPRRKGKYHIFCYVRFGTSIQRLESGYTSKLAREGYAGNLYVHMAEEIVGRLVFHNPIIESVEKVSFDLAKRRVVLDEDSSKVQEYKKLGYKADDDSKWSSQKKVSFVLTNSDVYRTAMEREMINSGKGSISIDFLGARSIYYRNSYDENGNKKPNRMSFLYLSDFVCTILGQNADASSPGNLVEDIKSKADGYTGHTDNLIFAYDDVDFIFKRAWAKLEEKEYFEALRLVHQGKVSESPYASYYTKVWFERIKKLLLEEKDMGAYELALRKYFLLMHSNNLKQDELIDIFKMFEEMLGRMNLDGSKNAAALYDLYDAGVSAYCHLGDSVHARECFEKCEKYAKYVDVERYLRTRNKMVVYLTDFLLFDEAFDIAEHNILLQENLLTVREMIFDKETTSTSYGIALSQKGQICASLHKPEAEQAFLEALDQFEENSANYIITLSYLLHYYIEMGEMDKYDSWAVRYFGGNGRPLDQLSYILRQAKKGEKSDYSMKFALYVYVKGLYSFHADKITSRLGEKLCNIRETIYSAAREKGTAQMKDHPWEIIYKYLALIALKRGCAVEAQGYVQEIRKSLNNTDAFLDAICAFGELEYARETGDDKTEVERLDRIRSIFKDNGYEIYETIDWDDTETAYTDLKENYLNYMYS